jgi:uncharacterized protein with PIN domain
MTDEELSARLQAEAEKVIARLVLNRPAAEAMSLQEVERLAVQVGAELSAQAQQLLSEEVSQRYREREQVCPQCGARMRRRGEHVRHITTEAGTSRLERTYYECAECGHYFFPTG